MWLNTGVHTGVQSQLVCSGCRNLLLYPMGATSVCCAVCNAVTTVPPPGGPSHSMPRNYRKIKSMKIQNCSENESHMFIAGTEMAQLVCGGCHTLLMYMRGATSVQCSCCHTINLAMEGDNIEYSYMKHFQCQHGRVCIIITFTVWTCRSHSKPGCPCQLWKLPHVVDVPIWSSVCKMCCLQLCDINWGIKKILIHFFFITFRILNVIWVASTVIASVLFVHAYLVSFGSILLDWVHFLGLISPELSFTSFSHSTGFP